MNAVSQTLGCHSQSPIIYSSSTIDRKYVHRQAVNEVFITSLYQLSDDHFIVSAVLPKSHMYFNDHPIRANGKQYYDATLLLEIFRQTSICVTHKYYGIPFSAKFIFNDAKFDILDHELLEISPLVSSVSVEVKIIAPKYRKNLLTGYTLEMILSIDNIPCAKK